MCHKCFTGCACLEADESDPPKLTGSPGQHPFTKSNLELENGGAELTLVGKLRSGRVFLDVISSEQYPKINKTILRPFLKITLNEAAEMTSWRSID